MNKLEISVPLGLCFLALSFFPYLTRYRIPTIKEQSGEPKFPACDSLVYGEPRGR